MKTLIKTSVLPVILLVHLLIKFVLIGEYTFTSGSIFSLPAVSQSSVSSVNHQFTQQLQEKITIIKINSVKHQKNNVLLFPEGHLLSQEENDYFALLANY